MTMHNLDTLGSMFLPEPITIAADVCYVSPESERFTSVTYRESETFDGEEFLVPVRAAG